MSKNIFCHLLFLSLAVFVNSVAVEESLLTRFKTAEKINIFVDFVSPQKSLWTLNSQTFETRDQQIENVVDSLKSLRNGCQSRAIKLLDETSLKYESFWISNQIYIKDATESLVKTLSEDPEVEQIREEIIITLDPMENLSSDQHDGKKSLLQWGVSKISAPAVWNLTTRGEGIVVGGIDSGVRHTHEALRSNYRSVNGWSDKVNGTTTPMDDNGHGTHTMGTIVGQGGIGVAPGARWIACRACYSSGNSASCPQISLTACGQWMLCPSGNNTNCQAPHIVSNSWGGGQNSDRFNSIIRSWISAGIVPVFSIGNDGSQGCSSARSPGDQLDDLLSVGSTAEDDSLSSFSSRGPTNIRGIFKPFISAPGQGVYSAYHNNDASYVLMQGTSMACPHVAGAVALLLSDKPLRDSSYANLISAIGKGATTNGLIPPNTNCGGINDRNFPNNAFGYGRLNVAASLQQWRTLKSASSTTIPFCLLTVVISMTSFFLK